jgi:5-(carboxyamino)imidazole ribonucleotide mutase
MPLPGAADRSFVDSARQRRFTRSATIAIFSLKRASDELVDPGSLQSRPLVGVVMGSQSDWDVMQHACAQLEAFAVPFESRVLSAHRMPDQMFANAEEARARGLKCIIAGAGGAAHLPGMLAAKTTVPVLGVPVPSRYLRGEDSLLSIVQMPRGIPVATFAIGEAGAANAGLFAVALLAGGDDGLRRRLDAFRSDQTARAQAMTLPPSP